MAGRGGHEAPDVQRRALAPEIEHAIQLLRDMRIRLSLFVIEDDQMSASLTAVLADELGCLGLTAVLGPGGLVLLHMAPRLPGGRGDTNVERLVLDHLRTLIGGFAGVRPASLPRVGVTHFHSDRAAAVSDLVAETTTLVEPTPAGNRPLVQA
jgi:hypothetical protein